MSVRSEDKYGVSLLGRVEGTHHSSPSSDVGVSDQINKGSLVMVRAGVRSVVNTAYKIKAHFACALERVVLNRDVQIRPRQHGRLVFLFDLAWKEHISVIATRIYWFITPCNF